MGKLYKSKSGRVVYGDMDHNKGIDLVGETFYNAINKKTSNLRPRFHNKTWNIKENFKEIKDTSIIFKNTKDIPSVKNRRTINVNGKKRLRPSFVTGLIKRHITTGEILAMYIFLYSPSRDEVSYFYREPNITKGLHTTSINKYDEVKLYTSDYESIHHFITKMLNSSNGYYNYEKINSDKIILKF
ncbi:MAG: hypothetical protein SLAVMIC_00648 [uncultured marine phage]|uniref:Uncharacterized protein n=1 Tax=uncultured marine phage TaxID=707152 RepID=A0A8D9CCK0_9VIRU|nr:MAG: hypothetical protein SLAVMIC_00648 [uncultured marine phage]